MFERNSDSISSNITTRASRDRTGLAQLLHRTRHVSFLAREKTTMMLRGVRSEEACVPSVWPRTISTAKFRPTNSLMCLTHSHAPLDQSISSSPSCIPRGPERLAGYGHRDFVHRSPWSSTSHRIPSLPPQHRLRCQLCPWSSLPFNTMT